MTRIEKALRIGATLLAISILLFVGAARTEAQSASATFLGIDTVSQGNWQSKYGADGYSIASSVQTLPSYAAFAPLNASNWTWAATTADMRGLETVSGRTATTWYSSSTFSLDINVTDQNLHQVALYAVDWDGRNRSEIIHIVDANSGTVLDARSISGFQNGLYLVWTVGGHITVNVTVTGGDNGVVSGVFFGGQPAATTATPSSAAFLGSDTTSQGNWQSKYGADGYSIAGGKQQSAAYASFAVHNDLSWTWAASTSDERALQEPSAPASAATWYNQPSFSLNVNMTDGKAHQFALYAVDWDSQGRSETVQIVDANSGAVLNTQNISNFSNGIYLVWTVSGHVQVNVTISTWPNAVVSGVFFGGATANPTPAAAQSTATIAPATASTPATTTQILAANTASLSFPSVTVSSSSSQTVTLTNAGTANVTISNVSVSGAGFNAGGSLVGTTLTPGQTAALTATFAPATSGNSSGTITVTSNATNGATVIALSGTAQAPVAHAVNLSWSAGDSAVIGYNVYVSTVSGTGYTKLTANPVPAADYSDTGLQAAQTRYYVVTSVNSNNVESAYSQQVSAIVP